MNAEIQATPKWATDFFLQQKQKDISLKTTTLSFTVCAALFVIYVPLLALEALRWDVFQCDLTLVILAFLFRNDF